MQNVDVGLFSLEQSRGANNTHIFYVLLDRPKLSVFSRLTLKMSVRGRVNNVIG